MNIKQILHSIVPDTIWHSLRRRKIITRHKAVAEICERLFNEFEREPIGCPEPLKNLGTEKIIWQYWAQGYDNLPEVVGKCLESVDKFKGDYKVIRLTDKTVSDYVTIPDYIEINRKNMSVAHYSDILRLMLLSAYGGIWMDATIFLTGPIPKEYLDCELFFFQRDPEEENKDYWENTYAYYFGWTDGFKVRMLSSFIVAKKHNQVINDLGGLIFRWWKYNSYLPDYFFFQILFDVLMNEKYDSRNCPIVSDCKPHYLQQYINDRNFCLLTKEEILRSIPIHKLTYK